MGAAITGDDEATEEEKEGHPPHLRPLQLFSRGCAYVLRYGRVITGNNNNKDRDGT